MRDSGEQILKAMWGKLGDTAIKKNKNKKTCIARIGNYLLLVPAKWRYNYCNIWTDMCT